MDLLELILFTAGCVVFLGSATVAVLKKRFDLLAFLIGASVLNGILVAVDASPTLIGLSAVVYLISVGVALAGKAKDARTSGEEWLGFGGAMFGYLLMAGLILGLAVAYADEGIWGAFAVMALFAGGVGYFLVGEVWRSRPS